MKTYIKNAKIGEILIFKELLNKIADVYNPIFSVLILPKAIIINERKFVLELPYYYGETFNEKWTEETGGSLLGLDLSVEIPQILYELSKIDVSLVLNNTRLQLIPRIIFDTQEYIQEFVFITNRLVKAKVLQKMEVKLIRRYITKKFESQIMVNNGDFYPRNFIRTYSKKIVLIDWETWNSNSKAYIVDYPENIAAFCFVHMWGNPLWQKNYVKELRNRFLINRRDFQRALLIKSLEMANFWYKENDNNQLCRNQLTILRNALNEDFMKSLWP
jgi:hypothetical protein